MIMLFISFLMPYHLLVLRPQSNREKLSDHSEAEEASVSRPLFQSRSRMQHPPRPLRCIESQHIKPMQRMAILQGFILRAYPTFKLGKFNPTPPPSIFETPPDVPCPVSD